MSAKRYTITEIMDGINRATDDVTNEHRDITLPEDLLVEVLDELANIGVHYIANPGDTYKEAMSHCYDR